MKYLIAGIVAAVLILGMFLFVRSVYAEIQELAKAHGIEDQNLQDYGMELTSGQLQRFSIADLLWSYRWPLSILILCTTFGIAFFCGSSKQPIENEKPATNEGTTSS